MNIALFARSWPKHNYNALGEYSISLTQTLINLTHNLCLCSSDPGGKEDIHNYPLKFMEIGKGVARAFDSWGKMGFKPDINIFDSVESEEKYSAFLYNRWNKTPRVLIINQLPLLSKWRKNNYKLIPNNLVPLNSLMCPQKKDQIFSTEEQRSIIRSDYIITGNSLIYYLLNKHIFKNQGQGMSSRYCSLVHYGLPLADFQTQIQGLQYRPFSNRENFVFMGNFDKETSVDSVFVLLNYIWPAIRKQLPDVQLHIYGTISNESISLNRLLQKLPGATKQSFSSLGIKIKGKMPETTGLSQYKAMLYPSTFSCGIHFKVLQSFFNHLPVITTPVGSEGLHLQVLDPQYSSSPDTMHSGFASQRQYTTQQKESSRRMRNYLQNNIFNKHDTFGFGGGYANFTYRDFVNNALLIYNDQRVWNQSLETGHKIIKRNFGQNHMQNVLKRALVNVEMAAYERRGKQQYQAQWKRYSKSAQFVKKVRS